MMYYAYNLNKRVTIYSLDVLLLLWNQSDVPCPVLTVASRPAYRCLRRQVRWSGIPIYWKISTDCCDLHKGFSIINNTEVNVFLEFLGFSMIQRVLAIWSLVPLPFLSPALTSESFHSSPTVESWLGVFSALHQILRVVSISFRWKYIYVKKKST